MCIDHKYKLYKYSNSCSSQIVEKKDDGQQRYDNQIVIITSENVPFMFAKIVDREVLISKITDLLSRIYV